MECTTPRASPKVSCRLRVITMCPCSFMDDDKGTFLWGVGVQTVGEAVVVGEAEGVWKNLCTF